MRPRDCQRIPSIILCLHFVFTQFPPHSDHVLLHHHFVPSPSVCRLDAGEWTPGTQFAFSLAVYYSQPLLQSQFLNVSNSISFRLSILISHVLSHLVSLLVPIQNRVSVETCSTSIEFVQYANVHPFAWSSGNCRLPVSDCLFWQMRPKARAANCVHRVCGTRQRRKKKKKKQKPETTKV